MEKIPDDLGTAVNVQAMVFGNMGDDFCTGVGFTRDPGTGEKVFYGEFLVNAQGEDVVAGIRTPQPISRARRRGMPESTTSSARSPASLEKHYKDMQDFEFTVRTASSTCCRPATASAPVRPRFASRSTWWTKA